MNWLRRRFSRRTPPLRNRVGIERLEHRLLLAVTAADLPNTPAVYSPATGTFFLRNENAGGIADTTFAFGPGGQGWIPIVGDWNGDGVDTVGAFEPNNSTFFLRNANGPGAADIIVGFGAPGNGGIPVVGDWDGDGTDTLGLFNPATGFWFLRNALAGGAADHVFAFGPGGAGWQPIVGDWNNDGVDSVGAYDPVTGTFHMNNSNAPGLASISVQFGPGGGGMLPLAGDWNGDGIDTIALQSPSAGTFNLRNVDLPGVADVSFAYGPSGTNWVPLTGNWLFDPFDTAGGLYPTPGNSDQLVPTKFTLLADQGDFRNELGVFAVDDETGSVNGIAPDAPGYAAAALSSPTRQIIFTADQGAGSMSTANLPGDGHFALYMIQDNTTAAFLTFNPSNTLNQLPQAFFSLLAANPDDFDHVKNLAPIVFAWEDQTFGGDKDFNESIVLFQFGKPFQAPPPPPPTPDMTPPVATITSPAPNQTFTTNVTVTGTATDDRAGVTAEAQIDSGAFFPLTLDAAGNFSFSTNLALDGSANGTHTVNVRARDAAGNQSPLASVSFVLNAMAQGPVAPVAADDSYSVDEDGALAIDVVMGLLANDSDANGDPLTAALVDDVTDGTLTLNSDGSFTYIPDADFNGSDSFTYQASDGALTSGVATVTITVNPVNDAPVAVDDAFTVDQPAVLNVAAPGVLDNDTDIDSATLEALLQTGPTSGTLTLELDGSFVYTPNTGFFGTDTFTYQASDGATNSANATVTITVNPAPIDAADDTFPVDEDLPLDVAAPGVLGNDTGGARTLTAVLNDTTTNGTLILNGDGSFSYIPNADFNGTDTFTYHANDGSTDSNIATVTITVNPIPDAPVAVDDAYDVDEDLTLTVDAATGVLFNDTDADGNTLTASLVTDVSFGTLTLNGDGSFTYTPDANLSGADTFTYVANDGTSDSAPATVTITVAAVNDAPVATDDPTVPTDPAYITNQDNQLNVNALDGVLANDTDIEFDPLTAAVVTGPASGTLTLNTDGSFIYTPNAGFFGTDTFTYVANDGTADSNTATVTITVIEAQPPVAVNDAFSVDEDNVLTIPLPGVLANDTDANNDPLTATIVAGASNGIATLNADGSFTYTPNQDFNGDDTFTYMANDGALDSNVATVTITVNPVNDAPIGQPDDFYFTDEDTTLTVPGAIFTDGVLANDSDPEGSPITAVLVGGGATFLNGTVTLNPDGSFDYTPPLNVSNTTDTFQYQVSDGTDLSAPVLVSIFINPVNDAPTAVADQFTISLSSGQSLDVPAPGVLSNDSDLESDPLFAIIDTFPGNFGTLNFFNSDGSFNYTPFAEGTDEFMYHVNDGQADSNIVTVTIIVTP